MMLSLLADKTMDVSSSFGDIWFVNIFHRIMPSEDVKLDISDSTF